MWDTFREATGKKLKLAGGKLRAIRDTRGAEGACGLRLRQGRMKRRDLFQKLVRTVFVPTTRPLHAAVPRVCGAALLDALGSVAGRTARGRRARRCRDRIGAHPTVHHPVAATFMKNAAKNGTKIILTDPRRSDLARHATYFLQFNGDTDVALLNGLLHVIIEEGLANQAFIRDRTEHYEALRENVKDYSPEKVAPITGIDAQHHP